jgi:ubiquinone/menaquinone biosynthesis C-methylase UbiE
MTALVQYGCGLSAPSGWVNFDASPTLRLERVPLIGVLRAESKRLFPLNVKYGDIVRGLPVASHSCRAVYCSHVLEHLSFEDFQTALSNTRRILVPGGIFRLVVPDLRAAAQRYVADESDTAATRFMSETYLGVQSRPRGLSGLLRSWLGNAQHLWMWDFESLRRELQAAGFSQIRRAQFGDSEESGFAAVEEQPRWVDAVGIQCYA